MTAPVRFAYAHPDASRAEGSLLAYMPITLRHDTSVLTVTGLKVRHIEATSVRGSIGAS